MQLFPAGSSEFWINLWEEAQHRSPMRKRRRRTETEMIEMWNRRAKEFAKFATKDGGQKKATKSAQFSRTRRRSSRRI